MRHDVHICGVYIDFASYITIEQVIEMNSSLRVLLSEVMAAVMALLMGKKQQFTQCLFTYQQMPANH